MKHVTIVNVGGTAYHIESDGVVALESWLGTAQSRLADDPDRDELLLDFERAISARFDERVTGERSVVATSDVNAVLAALGEVEPVSEPGPAKQPLSVSNGPSADRDRKLYRLTGNDKRIAGVCAGIAAYLRVDVTMVRALSVVLVLLTQGAALLTYLAMVIFVPKADTPEKRADALGSGRTAEEMIARARAGARPALHTLGSLILRITQVTARLLHILSIALIWLVTAAWATQVTWLSINGGGLTSAFDAGTSKWLVALWVTCIAWLVVAVLLVANTAVALLAGDRDQRVSRTRDAARASVAGAATIAALIGVFAIPAAASSQMRGLEDGVTTVRAYGSAWCVTSGHEQHPHDQSNACRNKVRLG